VTAGDDGTVRGWDVAGGPARVIAALGGAVRVVRHAPDGATLMVVGGAAGGAGGTSRGSGGTARGSGGTGGGGGGGSADDSSDAVLLRDARTGTPIRALAGPGATVTTAAFAPDGRTVAGGGTDRTVRIWDVATGALRHTLPERTAPVGSLAYAADGRSLITAAVDGVDVRQDLTALS
jgi:WD40 repeat protein